MEKSDNVIELRKNQPYKIGDLVHVGTGKDTYVVAGLGICGPHAAKPTQLLLDGQYEGTLTNESEFVFLSVPGMGHAVFDICVNFIRPALLHPSYPSSPNTSGR